MMGLICDGNTNYGLALEFCSGGPLNQWLKHYPGKDENFFKMNCLKDLN